MAQRLRIFISSPGDVPDERLRTDLIIDKLAQEYSRYFSIESYRWEHEPMLASGHFQDAIEPPSASDIVILILWSRLGTPLPERTAAREYHGLDGRAPVTGTEWEFEEALAAARLHGAPDILVFRNGSPTSIDSRDPAARAKSLQQLDALDAFWKRYFADRGVFLAGASEYRDIEEFAARAEESLRKLIERRIKAGVAPSAGDTAPTWLGNPFRGLQAYEFEHSAIFFGRDAMVAKAAEQLTSQARAGSSFLLFVGASGSGKSSLVKAALVPRLMKPQRIEGVAILRRVVFRPGDAHDDLLLGFAEALTRGTAQDGIGLPELLAPGQTAKDLAAFLRTNLAAPNFVFTSALGRVTEAAIASKRILPHEVAKIIIVIDQLEELFTLGQISAEDRHAFVQLINGLTHSGAVWVVATMRADFWHRILDLPDLLALAEGPGRVEVPAPSPAEMAEMIRKPAQAAGLLFETNRESGLGLDTVLAEHAASEPGVLPLLSFTLDALYREDVERRGGHVLTFAEYDRLGGLEGAIAKRADEVLESLPDSAKATAPRVLRALATLGGADNDVPVARSVPLNSFAPGSDARSVVDAFVAARLLVASTEGETATVRLAHESLISRWDRAREQLTADRRDLETRSLVERQFARWNQAEGSTREQLLLRDPDLANALDLERRWGDELGANVREFIARSHQRQRRRHQLAAAAAVVFGIVAIAATGFGFLAYRAEHQAEQARIRAVDAEAMAVTEKDHAVEQRNGALVSQSRYLAAEADSLVKDGNVRQAIALLRAALPDPQHDNNRPLVRDAIVAAYSALYSNRERLRVTLPSEASALTIAADGKSLFIAVPGKLLLRSGQTERELSHQFGTVSRLLLNGKGDLIAMIAPGGAISIRRLADNHELMTYRGDGAGTQVYFFDAARRLLVVSPDNKVWHLLDLEDGHEIASHTLSVDKTLVSLIAPEQGKIIAVGDSKIYRLSADDLSEQATSSTDSAAEYALALSPDGKSIFIAAAPDILTGRILVVDGETLALQRTFGRVVGGARHVAISPKSRWLAVHGILGIDFFDIESGERNYHLLASRDARDGGFFGSSGSDYIAYGPNGFIRRYAPELGVEMGAYRMGDGGTVEQIQELPDRSGFVSISDRPSASVWTFDSQVVSREYSVPLVIQGMDLHMAAPIEAFTFSADGNEVLASYADHSARRWNLQTGAFRVIREAELKADSIEFVALPADGISVLAEKSGRILIFTDANGAAAPVGEFSAEPLTYLGDLGDGRLLAVNKAGVPSALDVSDVSHPAKKEVPALANCPQQVSIPGRAFCVDKDGTIRVWDSRADRLMLELPAPAQARLHAGYISEDGSTIAAGYSNGEVLVKSLADGKTLVQRTLKAQLSGDALRNADRGGMLSQEDSAKVRQGAKSLEVPLGPNTMAVSPDSKWLAIAMPDRTVKLIDIASGEVRDTSGIHRGTGQEIEFSPDGKLVGVVEAGEYRVLNIYEVSSGERLANLSLSAQAAPRLRRLSSGKGFTTVDKGGRIVVHPVFENWQDLVSYLAKEFPDPLTQKQRRAFFID